MALREANVAMREDQVKATEKQLRANDQQLRRRESVLMAQEQRVELMSKLVVRPLEACAKVGRNERCPCGSDLKYKHCHGSTGGRSQPDMRWSHLVRHGGCWSVGSWSGRAYLSGIG